MKYQITEITNISILFKMYKRKLQFRYFQLVIKHVAGKYIAIVFKPFNLELRPWVPNMTTRNAANQKSLVKYTCIDTKSETVASYTG